MDIDQYFFNLSDTFPRIFNSLKLIRLIRWIYHNHHDLIFIYFVSYYNKS